MDGVAYYHVEVLVATVAVDRHSGGDTGVFLGYLAKADHLHHLALRGDQLLLAEIMVMERCWKLDGEN